MKVNILTNFTNLAFLNLLNILVPFITAPYLIRVIGVGNFGVLSLASVFAGYFAILIDYSFSITAVRDVADCNDIIIISKKMWTIIAAKLVLFAVGIAPYIITISIFIKFQEYFTLYFLSYLALFPLVLKLDFLFKGLQRTKQFLISELCAKVVYIVFIFMFIKKESDFILIPLFQLVSYGSTNLILLLHTKKELILFKMPNTNLIRYELKKGFPVFTANLSISLYDRSRIFFVGIFTTNEITGMFAFIEKLIRVHQYFPTIPLLDASFPIFVNNFRASLDTLRKQVRKYQLYLNLYFILISIILSIYSEQIINLTMGAVPSMSVDLFRLLIFASIIINANAFTIKYFLALGEDRFFMEVHVFSAIIGLLLGLIMTAFFGVWGLVGIIIFLEIVILAIFKYQFYKTEEKK